MSDERIERVRDVLTFSSDEDSHDALADLASLQQELERLRAEDVREPKPDAVLVDGVRLDQLRRIEEAARALSEVVEEAESVGICLPTRAEALALRAALDQEVKG